MRFEWDEDKDRRNLVKHGVSFKTARLVFDDPRAINLQDRVENGEERWQTLGSIGPAVILLVAHAYQDDEAGEEIIRIISARKATHRERQMYEQDDR